jgi:hypothetical protein
MKFTEAQLEAVRTARGANDECSVMSSEFIREAQYPDRNPVKPSGYTGNIAEAPKSGQRSRHQSRQMARLSPAQRGQITNRDTNRDTPKELGLASENLYNIHIS